MANPAWLQPSLGDWLVDDTVEEHQALDIAQRICYRHALELYRLDSSWLGSTMGTSGIPVNAS
jgi:hypothetical protein